LSRPPLKLWFDVGTKRNTTERSSYCWFIRCGLM
jgi:hypothetical protein